MWQTYNSHRLHHRSRRYFRILNLISSPRRIHIFSCTEIVRIPVLLCNGLLLFSWSSVIPNVEYASPLQNTLRNFDANRLKRIQWKFAAMFVFVLYYLPLYIRLSASKFTYFTRYKASFYALFIYIFVEPKFYPSVLDIKILLLYS
jgi:hypothetical protein